MGELVEDPGLSHLDALVLEGPTNIQGRRAWISSGQNPENPVGRTNFDIGRVVRLFRTGGVGAHRLTLRKLHVRWWHASKDVMRRFLERVGVPDEILSLIPEICDTCRVARPR